MPKGQVYAECGIRYTNPQVRKTNRKDCKRPSYYVDFYCVKPSTGKMTRVKRKINEVRWNSNGWDDFCVRKEQIVAEYARMLANGWDPWTGEYHFRGVTKMVPAECLVDDSKTLPTETGNNHDHFADAGKMVESRIKPYKDSVASRIKCQNVSEGIEIAKSDTKNVSNDVDVALMERKMTTIEDGVRRWLANKNGLRKATLHSYKSIGTKLVEWVAEQYGGMQLRDFTRLHANLFMESIDAKDCRPATYNNYLGNIRTFFAWALEREYVEFNAFDKLKDKPKVEKKRDAIPLEDLRKIREWFHDNRPEFEVVMLLMYFAGMRPTEISRVQVRNIKLVHRGIEMTGDMTKTHAARVAPLSEELVLMLADMVKYAKADDYLIGEGFKPGRQAISTKMYQKTWYKMRDSLGMPETYQLYSLRDSGAFHRMESTKVAPLDTMQAMGHKHLSQTLEYANHAVRDLAKRLDEGTPKI